MQVPLRFNYLFALEPIYLNIKGIDLLLIIIIERLEYTLPLFWTRPVKPRLITYQLLYDATAATLDNTSNNNTTCKTIQDIHTRRGLVWKSDEQQLPYVQLPSHTFLTLTNPQVSRARRQPREC